MAYDIVTERHVCLGERVPIDAALASVAMLPPPVTLLVEGNSIVQEVKSLLVRHEVDRVRGDLSELELEVTMSNGDD